MLLYSIFQIILCVNKRIHGLEFSNYGAMLMLKVLDLGAFQIFRLGKNHFKIFIIAGHWWLTPVILTTQEADISSKPHSSKPALGKYLKKKKRGGRAAQGVECLLSKHEAEFKLQYRQNAY
jgi:hypothetical protein